MPARIGIVKLFRDLLTADKDSKVYDLMRVITAASAVTGLALTCYVAWQKDEFDITAFGTGMGLIIAAGGGAAALRKDTE